MPPRDAAGAKIPCPTPQHLQVEADTLAVALEPGETENTWDALERAIIRFGAVTRGGGYKHIDDYVRVVGAKGVGLKLVDCMLSDRGRLSGAATDLVQTFAPRLGTHMQPLVQVYLPALVRLLARPNKVYLRRAERCVSTIIAHCPLPAVLPHLRTGLDDRSDACKRASAVAIEQAANEWEPARFHEKDVVVLETCIRKMGTDRDADVRKTAKRVWARFAEVWPERVDEFTAPLTPTIRRYLDLPPADGGAGPSRPKPRPGLGPAKQPHHGHHQSTAPASSSASASLSRPASTDRERPPVPAEAHPRPQRPQHEPASALASGAQRTRRPEAEADVRLRMPSGASRAVEPLATGAARLTRSTSAAAATAAAAAHGSGHLSHASSSSSIHSEARSNPLSKPSRSTAVTLELAGEAAVPARRFAPPQRMVRPVESEEPDTARRPTRAAAERGVAMGKLGGLGGAQRRAPPSATSSSTRTVTPTQPPSRTVTSTQRVVTPEPMTSELQSYVASTAGSTTPQKPPPASLAAPRAAINKASHDSLRSVSSARSESSTTPQSDRKRLSMRVRERVLDIERSSDGTPLRRLSWNPDLALAAGIPLPADTPPSKEKDRGGVNASTSTNASTYSPSLSMLLGKHKVSTDPDLTLADLSMVSAADADSPMRVSSAFTSALASTTTSTPAAGVSGLSRSLQNTPHVADLVQKFSSPASALPSGTPLRRVASESIATPSPAVSSSAAATPTPTAARCISPLPRRSPLADVAETTPSRPLKRKGSDLEMQRALAAAHAAVATPLQPQPQPAPVAFEEPLIAFGDSPVRLVDPAPFVFRGARLLSRQSTVNDLMGLDLGGLGTPAKPRAAAAAAAAAVAATPAAAAIAEDEEEEEDEGTRSAFEDADEDERVSPSEEENDEADTTVVPGRDEDALMRELLLATAPPREPAPLPEPVPLPEVEAEVEPDVQQEAEIEPEAEEPQPEPALFDVEPEVPEPEPEAPVELEQAVPKSEPEDIIDEPVPAVINAMDPVVDPTPAAVDEVVSEAEMEDEAAGDVTAVLLSQPEIVAEETLIATEAATEPESAAPVDAIVLVDTAPAIESTPAYPESALQLDVTPTDTPTPDDSTPTGMVTPANAVTPDPEETPQPPSTARAASRSSARRPLSAAKRHIDGPVEKKTFRPGRTPVGVGLGRPDNKAAPAPARVATRSASATGPTAASAARQAAATAQVAAAAAAAPVPAPVPVKNARIVSAPPPQPSFAKPAQSKSSLFKPTAATAARAAAAAAAKEKRDRPTSRPMTPHEGAQETAPAAPVPAAPPVAAPPRRAGGLFAPTAASRAREAALPPVKRQRIKLTAPAETFRPGRSGANKSKAAVLGAGAAAGAAGPSRRARTARGAAKTATTTAPETFPLPGPGLNPSTSTSTTTTTTTDQDQGKALRVSSEEKPREITAALDTLCIPLSASVPASTDTVDLSEPLLTPTGSSFLGLAATSSVTSSQVSPASSRLTSGSYLSVSSSGRSPGCSGFSSGYSSAGRSPSKKLTPRPSRPLEPVLTAAHSPLVAPKPTAVVGPTSAESPAVAHTRRVSGIPASLKKAIADGRAAAEAMPQTPSRRVSTRRVSASAAAVLAAHAEDHDAPPSGAGDDDEPHLTPKPRPGPMTRRRAALRESLAAAATATAAQATPQAAENENDEPPHSNDDREREHDRELSVARHDVSTPTTKAAASLLARLHGVLEGEAGRRVLSPRDANAKRSVV